MLELPKHYVILIRSKLDPTETAKI